MFGSRKRIGYIGPTVMEVVPYEFYRFAPDGVGLVGVTCNIDDWSKEYFDRRWRRSRRPRPISARAASISSCTAAGRSWWRAARATRTSSSATSRRPPRSRRLDRRARRHGGAAPYRRAARRDRLALSGAAQRGDGRLSASFGFEIVRAEGMDVPFKELQNVPPADIHAFARGVLDRAGPVRRALSALPAMAGGADGRCAGTRARRCRRSPIPTQASSSHSRRSASRMRSAATAGCWRRCGVDDDWISRNCGQQPRRFPLPACGRGSG